MPHQIHGEHLTVGGSVGVYLAGPWETAGEALRCADQAMYVVKNSRPRAGPRPSP